MFDTKAKAERWARLVESEMDRGYFVSTTESEQTTLEELLTRYSLEVVPLKKSRRKINSNIKILIEHLGYYPLAALTPRVISAFRDQRLETLTPDSVRKDLSLLRRALDHAQKEWEIYLPKGNPVSSVKIPSQAKGRERRLSVGEEALLLREASEYGGQIQQIIILAIETGMRRGELAELKWRDINLENATASLRDTKNGEDRVVPLSSVAIALLRQLDSKENNFVFSMQADSITRAFTRVCKKAQLEDLRFHYLRHEATSRFFEMGLSIMEVASITGHNDLSMLNRYTHLRAEDLAKKLN